MKRAIVSLIVLLLLTLGTAQAQDMGPTMPRVSYFLAADASGVQQVYQLLLDGQSEPRQITYAESDVLTFGPAYDGLSVAYISGGQLWLQPIHTEEAQVLAPVTAERFFGAPVFSQDNQYIAYSDNGIWLFDLSTRETTQILEDVPLSADASNMAEVVNYQPERFVLGPDGRAAKLVVDRMIWEWNSAGVYDLTTGELQVLEGQTHTHLLPLYGDRVLVYGNSGVAGEFALHLAESLEDINNYTKVLDFSEITDQVLFAENAVELAPGVVRVFGQTISTVPNALGGFYFDVDLMNDTVSEVNFVTLDDGSSGGFPNIGPLSPDGSMVQMHRNAEWTETNGVVGQPALIDLATGEEVEAAFPETVGVLRWQP